MLINQLNILDATQPLDLSVRLSDDSILHCQKTLRLRNKSRLVCLAQWKNTTVIAKLFWQPYKAKYHLTREKRLADYFHTQQLPYPKVLYSGSDDSQKIHILIFEYLGNTQGLNSILTTLPSKQFADLGALLYQIHQAKLQHNDPSVTNFLVSPEKIYMIDATAFILHKKPLPLKMRLKDLCIILFQISHQLAQQKQTIVNTYLQLSGFSASDSHIKKLFEKMHRSLLKKYIMRHVKRSMRTTTGRTFFKNKQICFSCEKPYFTAEMKTFLTSDLPKTSQDIVINEHAFSLQVFEKQTCLTTSKARQVWISAIKNYCQDDSSAMPVAFIEKAVGKFQKQSFLLWSSSRLKPES